MDSENNTTPETTVAEPEKVTERIFTQEEVSAMMAKEKRQGKNSVYSDLGIDPKNSDMVKAVKDFVQAQVKAEETAARADVERQLAEATARLRLAETKAAIMIEGVQPLYVEDAALIVMSKLSSDESLTAKEVMNELRPRYPLWFENKESSRGTGASIGGGTRETQSTPGSFGAKLAGMRK